MLSLVNMKLRDSYSSLAELCGEEDADCDEICARLREYGYAYDQAANAFKPVI